MINTILMFFFKKISKPFITEHKNSHWHRNIMFHPTNGYFDLSKTAIEQFRFSTEPLYC